MFYVHMSAVAGTTVISVIIFMFILVEIVYFLIKKWNNTIHLFCNMNMHPQNINAFLYQPTIPT